MSKEKEKFYEFVKEFNLSDDIFEKLWKGNITSPQDIALCTKDEICKIVDNNKTVCKVIYPMLEPHARQISVAKDPYQLATKLLRNNDEETDDKNTNRYQPQGKVYTFTNSDVNKAIVGEGNIMGNISADSSEKDSKGRKLLEPSTPSAKKIKGYQPQGKVYTFTNSDVKDAIVGEDNKMDNMSTDSSEKADLQFRDNKEFSWSDVQSCDDAVYRNRLKDSKYYPILTRKSNRAIIINNVVFSGKHKTRGGADEDTKKLEIVLDKLGFQVTTFTNKDISKIKQCLREFASSPENEDTSATVVFIGSHGSETNKEAYFIGTNGERISAEEVCEYFSATNCPILIERPKIFFFQCCRSVRQTKPQADSVEEDSPVNMDFLPSIDSDATVDVPEAHNMADMLVSFATASGTKAYRDKNEGSWFVTALCRILAEEAKTEDLLSMMTMVNDSVMAKSSLNKTGQKAVQMAVFKSTLSKKVRFYP